MANHLRTPLGVDTFEMVRRQRRPSEVIHPADQGSLYPSLAFGHRGQQAGGRPAMGSVGDGYDNAWCESFLVTLEGE